MSSLLPGAMWKARCRMIGIETRIIDRTAAMHLQLSRVPFYLEPRGRDAIACLACPDGEQLLPGYQNI
jgi:hypothetical protein